MTGHDAVEWAVTMPWNGRSRSRGACNKHLGAGHSVLCSLNGHIVRVQATTASGLVVDDPFGASKLTASSYKFSTKNRGRGTGKEWDPTNDTNEGEDHAWSWQEVESHTFGWIYAFSR